MAINANETFTIDLSVFGSLVKDLAPANLPAGASPDNADCFYGAQYVATRPAFIQVLQNVLTGDVLSHLDYPQPTGQTNTITLTDDGAITSSNVQTGVQTQLGQVTPGVRFKAIAAFDKFFMAFRGLSLTSPFTSAQLAGGDVPRYVNSLGHLWRLTSDAPGGGLVITGVNIGPEDLVTPATFTLGPNVTSIVFSGLQPGTPTSYYTTATVTLASAQSLTVGQSVQMYGITWATAGGPQFPSGVQIQSVISSTQFVIPIVPAATYNSGTGGTFAFASGGVTLTRDGNIVTGYLQGTTPTAPTAIQQGWFVVLSDADPSAVAGSVPDGSAPFIKNELFQAILPSNAGGTQSVSWLSGGVITYYQGSGSGCPIGFTFPGDGANKPIASIITATVPMENNWACMANPPQTYLSGVPSNLWDTTPMKEYGITPDGTWDGTATIPGGYIPNNVGDFTQANWNSVRTSKIYVAAAGTITFKVAHADSVIIGMSGGAVPGGSNIMFNGSSSEQTKTILNGYPIMMMNNLNESDGYSSYVEDTFTVTFPAAGNYDIEMDYACHDDARTLALVWENGATFVPVIPASGASAGVATVTGDGAGNITVQLPTTIANLPIGSWLYLYLLPPAPAAVTNWVQTSAGFGLITVPGVTWTVGTEVQLNGFTGSGQPSTWNTIVVTITAVDNDDYQFSFASTTASSGVTSTGTATPVSANYPSGWVQVTAVPNPSTFVFNAIGNTNTTTALGVVYDYFGSLNSSASLTGNNANASSGIVQGFQVLSVDTTTTPNKITWFQSGFDNSYIGNHVLQVQPNSQVAGGPRSAVCFFINEDGGATPASYPLLIQLNGGNQYPNVQLPIGPPGTVKRGVGFTPAYGAEYYALGESTQPLTASGGPIINLGTIVPDNTTSQLIMDFSDSALTNGIPIGPGAAALGSDFGDLTSTIVLPPCLGVLEYDSSLVFWGELNCLPNHSMKNMGFDGGFSPSAGEASTGPNTTQIGITTGAGSPWINPSYVSSPSLFATVQTGPTGPVYPPPSVIEIPMPILQAGVGAHPQPGDPLPPGNIVTVYYNDIHDEPGPDTNLINAFNSPAGAYITMSGGTLPSQMRGTFKVTAYGDDKPYHDTQDTHNWFEFICPGPPLATYAEYGSASYQQVSQQLSDFSQDLRATNAGFALGSQGTMAGVQVSFFLKALFNTAVVTVQLLKHGVPTGSTKTVNATTVNTKVVLGNATDLWDAVLAISDVNNNGFGVQISVTDTSSNINTTSVQNVQMTVFTVTAGGMAGAMPLGWDSKTPYNGITPDGNGSLVVNPNGLGFAYEMPSSSQGTLLSKWVASSSLTAPWFTFTNDSLVTDQFTPAGNAGIQYLPSADYFPALAAWNPSLLFFSNNDAAAAIFRGQPQAHQGFDFSTVVSLHYDTLNWLSDGASGTMKTGISSGDNWSGEFDSYIGFVGSKPGGGIWGNWLLVMSDGRVQTSIDTGIQVYDYQGIGEGGTLTLTGVENNAGGNTVYTGNIVGGADNAYETGNGTAGQPTTFLVQGFANPANNGVYVCTASSLTTLTLANPNGVAETNNIPTASYGGVRTTLGFRVNAEGTLVTWTINGVAVGSASTNIPVGSNMGLANYFQSQSPDGTIWYRVESLQLSELAYSNNCMLSQGAYQDFYGTPVVLPNRNYLMRHEAVLVSGTPSGNLAFVLYSPSVGVLSTALVPLAGVTTQEGWLTGFFDTQMPVTIPNDTVFYFELDGTATTDFVIDIDELEIIDADQPVLAHQLRISYPDNEFGYDNENGYTIGLDTTDFIASAFVQRNFLYVNTENELHTIQNTAALPAQWSTALHAKECGCSGPDAVTTGRSTAWWMGRHGVQMFDGSQPKKINQYVIQEFEKTNWNAAVNSCCGHDAVQQVMCFSWPTGTNINPDTAYTMNFRLSDSAVNVPDPVHVSAYTGRLIATDLGLKWSPLRRPINSIQMSTQQTPAGVAKVMTFGGAGYGQLYAQDFQLYPPVTGDFSAWNCIDADYGLIDSYYQTYFFYAHDTEQQPQLALYRKLFAYMAFHAVGVGDLTITPFVDAMNRPWTPLPTYTLTLADTGFDYDIGLNVTGNRMSLRFDSSETPASPPVNTGSAFMLTHLIVSGRKDNVFPVRGAF